jgi:multiple sugar transport system permease protein
MQTPWYRKVILMSLLVILLFFVLVPFYWMFTSSIKTAPEIISRRVTLIPQSFVLDHYGKLLTSSPFIKYTGNSTLVALGTTLISVVLAVLAAYGIFEMRFPGHRTVLRLMLVAYAFPGILLLIPLYILMSSIHLVDTPFALMVINVVFTAPFSVWLLQAFFRTIPTGITDAALVDGAGRMYILWRIILPLISPGIASIAIFSFVTVWTEYVFASIMINSDAYRTLPPGLAGIIGQYQIDWGLLTAGAMATTLPVIVLFAFFGRYFVRGLTQGAVKG